MGYRHDFPSLLEPPSKSYALIAMTNKDIYHVTVATAQFVQKKLLHTEESLFIEVRDIKQGSDVVLNVNHISSVVVMEVSDAKR